MSADNPGAIIAAGSAPGWHVAGRWRAVAVGFGLLTPLGEGSCSIRFLHAALVRRYKETEPHYKPENVQRVREILVSLRQRTRGTSLLDLGCGAGFVIDIAKGVFDIIRGIHICEPMLSRIDTSCRESDIQVSLAPTDDTPFDDNTFDVCTAYAVLHHLDALEPTFREAYRVLRPGGILYTDLDPNAYFWKALRQLPPNATYSAVVRREIDGVLHKDDELLERFGIAPQLLHTAEHLKHDQGGFREEGPVLRWAARDSARSRFSTSGSWARPA